jgi:hypothetical protein
MSIVKVKMSPKKYMSVYTFTVSFVKKMRVGRVRGNTGYLGDIANFFPVASFHVYILACIL